MTFIASAPGKVLWIGGYSVVEFGSPAHVLAIDKRIQATVEIAKGISFKIPDLSVDVQGKIENHKVSFSSKTSEAAIHFMQSVVEEFSKYAQSKNVEFQGAHIETKSDPAFYLKHGSSKSGLGSSAAATAAITGALMHAHGFTNEKHIYRLAQVAHANAQNKVGSGFDVAAACYGTLEYSRYSEEIIDRSYPALVEESWDCLVNPTKAPPYKFILGHTGKSASTTELVSKITAFGEEHMEEYQARNHNLNQVNAAAITAFKENNDEDFKQFFNEGRAHFRDLGKWAGVELESAEDTKLLDLAVKEGAFVAKQPGAGGGDSLLAVCEDDVCLEKVQAAWNAKGLKTLPIQIEEQGLLYDESNG